MNRLCGGTQRRRETGDEVWSPHSHSCTAPRCKPPRPTCAKASLSRSRGEAGASARSITSHPVAMNIDRSTTSPHLPCPSCSPAEPGANGEEAARAVSMAASCRTMSRGHPCLRPRIGAVHRAAPPRKLARAWMNMSKHDRYLLGLRQGRFSARRLPCRPTTRIISSSSPPGRPSTSRYRNPRNQRGGR